MRNHSHQPPRSNPRPEENSISELQLCHLHTKLCLSKIELHLGMRFACQAWLTHGIKCSNFPQELAAPVLAFFPVFLAWSTSLRPTGLFTPKSFLPFHCLAFPFSDFSSFFSLSFPLSGAFLACQVTPHWLGRNGRNKQPWTTNRC